MKSRLLLFIFSLSIVIFGCKKDASTEDKLTSAKKQIIGTWQVQSGIFTYYDASGKVISTNPTNDGINSQFQFDAVTLKTSQSPTDTYPYTLTDVDGRVMIGVVGVSYEVKFNNNSMTWSQEKQHQNEAYVKSVYTVQYKKL